MKCKNCGFENKENAKFCGNCGKNLIEQIPEEKTEQKNNGKKKIWIFGTGILMIVLAVIIIRLLNVEEDIPDYDSLVAKGDRYLEELDYENAEEAYLEAIAIEPKKKEPYLKLTQLYTEQENYKETLVTAEKAMEELPEEEQKEFETIIEESTQKCNAALKEKYQEVVSEYTEALTNSSKEYAYIPAEKIQWIEESKSNTPGSLYYVLCDLNQDNLVECMVGCYPYEETRFLGIYAFDGEDIFLLTEGADFVWPGKDGYLIECHITDDKGNGNIDIVQLGEKTYEKKEIESFEEINEETQADYMEYVSDTYMHKYPLLGDFVGYPMDFPVESALDFMVNREPPRYTMGEELELYGDTLNKYSTALKEHWDMDKCTEEEITTLVSTCEDGADLRFKLLDIDGDGIRELMITQKYESESIASGNFSSTLYALYTFVNDKVTLLCSSNMGEMCYYCLDNTIKKQGVHSASSASWYKLEEGTLEELGSISRSNPSSSGDPYFYDSEGNQISEEEWDNENNSHESRNIDNDFYISLEYLPYMIQEYTQADPCISAYQDIVSAYMGAENCSDEERESLYPYVDTSYINRLDEVRYYLYDIDGNGIEELIFAWEYETGKYQNFDLYGYDGKNAVKMIFKEGNSSWKCPVDIYTDGTIQVFYTGGSTLEGRIDFCKLRADGYSTEVTKSYEVDFTQGREKPYFNDQEAFTEEEYNRKMETYTPITVKEYYTLDISIALGKTGENVTQGENKQEMTEAEVYEKLETYYEKEDPELMVQKGKINSGKYETLVLSQVPGNPNAVQAVYDISVDIQTGDVTEIRVLTDNRVRTYNLKEV